MKNLKQLKDQIKNLKKKSLTEVAKHSIGYHGSAKDRCIYCDQGYDANEVNSAVACTEETQKTRASLARQANTLETKLLPVLQALQAKNKKILFPFINIYK